jgi:ATP-dependent RNA circularization protein (DNA/RNA ligase family)
LKLLSEPTDGKIIPRNFGNIKHLTGSRMKDSGDTLLDKVLQPIFVEKLQFPKRDKLFVTEKIDGANVGVLKKNGRLYPVMRKGYDVRSSEWDFIRRFADFVTDNANRFNELLGDGERVCGEWMIKTHSLFYEMPHEPFIVFDIINADAKQSRPCYDEVRERCVKYEFVTSGLVWEGEAISIENALKKLGNGFHGCQSEPEGVVYRYERDGSFEMSAKYVSNLDVDGCEMDNDVYSKWKNWGF